MSRPKIVVSVPVDSATLERLDAFCTEKNCSRSEILRGLLDALLIDGKPFTFREWRTRLSPVPPTPKRPSYNQLVLAALGQSRQFVRARSVVRMLSGRVSRTNVYHTLNALIEAGKVEREEGMPLVSNDGTTYWYWTYRSVQDEG